MRKEVEKGDIIKNRDNTRCKESKEKKEYAKYKKCDEL